MTEEWESDLPADIHAAPAGHKAELLTQPRDTALHTTASFYGNDFLYVTVSLVRQHTKELCIPQRVACNNLSLSALCTSCWEVPCQLYSTLLFVCLFAGLELIEVRLLRPPECWDERHVRLQHIFGDWLGSMLCLDSLTSTLFPWSPF